MSIVSPATRISLVLPPPTKGQSCTCARVLPRHKSSAATTTNPAGRPTPLPPPARRVCSGACRYTSAGAAWLAISPQRRAPCCPQTRHGATGQLLRCSPPSHSVPCVTHPREDNSSSRKLKRFSFNFPIENHDEWGFFTRSPLPCWREVGDRGDRSPGRGAAGIWRHYSPRAQRSRPVLCWCRTIRRIRATPGERVRGGT